MKPAFFLIGEPASGKTTLACRLMRMLQLAGEGHHNLHAGLLRGHLFSATQVLVLGRYDVEGTFKGTDRLSHAVHNDFRAALPSLKQYAIFIEGDRLLTADNIRALQATHYLMIGSLSIDPETAEDRHLHRGDTQSATFIQGRRTKVANISKQFPTTLMPNSTPEHLESNIKVIAEHLGLVRNSG